MTAPQAGNPASTFAATVGRYFTVISVVPSLVLVAFVTVLARSGAWSREPDFGEGIQSLTQAGLGGAFTLILTALALGIVLHPLQYALVQFLEGYWNVSPFWQAVRANRIRHHALRRDRFGQRRGDVAEELGMVGSDAERELDGWEHAVLSAEKVATERQLSIYPADEGHLMPTRLGNVLRAAETRAGKAFGLDIIDVRPTPDDGCAPRARRVRERPADGLGPGRPNLPGLPSRVRLCRAVPVPAQAVAAALIPLGLSWLCYLGAITAAQEYGEALRMLVDLNRFALYEQLRLPLPSTTSSERSTVANIRKLSSKPEATASVWYRHPEDTPDSESSER